MTITQRQVVLLYGGTFDPVHNGHMALLWEVQHQLRAQAVHLLPCYIPPHKSAPATPVVHRVAMLHLVTDELNAACGASVFAVDTQEVERGQVSYTIDTLIACREQWGPQVALVWVMGMDSWLQLNTWQRWQELTNYAHLAVVGRPDHQGVTNPEQQIWSQTRIAGPDSIRASAAGGVVMLNTTLLAIGSTQIREQLQRGIRPLGLVPSSVDAYIQRHGLYSTSN